MLTSGGILRKFVGFKSRNDNQMFVVQCVIHFNQHTVSVRVCVRSTRIWNDLQSFLKERPSVHSLKTDLTNIYFASFKEIDTFKVFI